ncbi:IclR family transcriptional regulator [Alicyclobacillus fastidiosus]|uniref:IclR family transcriptional regulator n=1 Tax=Alicyclobacillus fastidiosus TaxID=392011 RepID=A0ABV5ACS9_9BACL|nr:IclR family transcriptional regulator [Alicyclobacillus fastidiosus]WEH11271.1 IclR family transcriptional regulator [Alicyclobacillus fastidiosus]
MDYYVPSVALSVRMLKLLSRYKYKACSLTQIAELTGANKTTCLRVLRTLEAEDLIKYDAQTKQYSLGQYLIPLGYRALQLNDSVSRATAELRSVANSTGLTTVLIERLQDDHLIYIASEEPLGEVHISVSIGQQFPLVGAGFGRCFLAYDDESSWPRWIDQGLVEYTPQSITDAQLFVNILRDIRSTGYHVSHGGLMQGVSSVAAPIFGKHGDVEWVMACLATTSELQSERAESVAHTLLHTTQALSEWNGYHTGEGGKMR